ncbi:hypothetical protein ECHHL_0301 [Ehrlichia chaffeensis str. Heartland]|uniref:Uncharacterized protein n=1 Tax=Ehrlichia chaffeensis (strain ATCC CRL-10679 / Arkansas) TaxID=205920 RepID=Q2GHB0_EHRCR|nr:hypothetical protein [Ehrlichia chaffeensis]ABD44888.1 hypothetical protein ECH_0353 [Ehrlichia chaffeensis str. Arkansas]AHX03466.1 hypothetical protein ECHHL_0301 [Ehrlichia chaffeensis str. Heartland]AHX05814.1 hypothetical protein ECHJAX_0757 [Ehrlichia chaffeensis str. Jax]AHX06806.1 hypothetical protein ECHLIB_0761 [Ehrlichia chaffeensis str. Liberty]AHX07275.1 hypothetical protein ECHOSC_0310 [Ehrlichia chaffeensis str. Osceola]
MRFFLHDISKMSVSLFGIAIGTLGITNRVVKKCLSAYLRNSGFVTQDELDTLSSSVREIASKQNEIEKQLSQK